MQQSCESRQRKSGFLLYPVNSQQVPCVREQRDQLVIRKLPLVTKMVWGRKRIDVESMIFPTCSNFAHEVCTTQNPFPYPSQNLTATSRNLLPLPQAVCHALGCVPSRKGYVLYFWVGAGGTKCVHVCAPILRERVPSASPVVPALSTVVPGAPEWMLHDCSHPGREKKHWTRVVGWTILRRVPQEVILMCSSIQRQPRRSGPGSIPLPSYVISPVAPEDRIVASTPLRYCPLTLVQRYRPKKCCLVCWIVFTHLLAHGL